MLNRLRKKTLVSHSTVSAVGKSQSNQRILSIGLALISLTTRAQAATPILYFGAGDLDSVLGEGMKIIMKIGFLVGTVMIMYSGLQLSRGQQLDSMMGIGGGLLLALAGTIMDKFFTTAGLDPINF